MRFIQPAVLTPIFVLLLVHCASAADETKPKPPAPEESFSAMLTGGMAPYTLHVNAVDLPLKHGNWLTARYEWDFGDATPGSRFNQLVGWTAGHVYTTPGSYLVSLTLTDEAGEKRVFKKSFIIERDKRRIIYV